MRAHYLQHVPFEGLGTIARWLESRDAVVTASRLWENADLPAAADFDWLIVMGGPMGVNDTEEHRWLSAEVRLIADAIEADKVVLGVCLGAQLIAAALGARVFPHTHAEIGWFPVEPVESAGLSGGAPWTEPFEALHWHGDTFELPAGAVHVARSAACEHQAFAVGDRVLGLQFHLEMTRVGLERLVDACRAELMPATWVQSEAALLGEEAPFAPCQGRMDALLDHLAERAVARR